MKYIHLGMVAFVATFTTCSGLSQHEDPGVGEPVKLSLTEAIEHIDSIPPDDQIDLYLDSRRQEPPSYLLRKAVARSGVKVVPAIIKRLDREESFLNTMALAELLYTMNDLGYYRVASDQILMATLRSRSAEMKSPFMKQELDSVISDIVAGQGIR